MAINKLPTGSVTISGNKVQGQILTAANSLADGDGLGAITYTWKNNLGTILGTGSTFLLTQAQVGKTITVTASYTDRRGTFESKTSSATTSIANVNDLGQVALSGTATQGQTLTATVSDIDGLPATINYQWKANGVSIGGATSKTFTLGEAQVGKAITCNVSYTDLYGTAENRTSNATGLVANVNDAAIGSVSISGIASQGQVLTASNTLADLDGLGTINYTWKDNLGNTLGTGASISLTEAHVGKSISVIASYTDGHGTAESRVSASTANVANINDAVTGSVSISGLAAQGQVLTASNTLADLDGLGPISYTWKADGNVIGSGSSFTLTEAQVGKSISVVASYTDGHGTVESVASAATANVANVNDAVTGAVSISGIATQGQVLTASNTLADIDGLGVISYTWKAGGNVIGSGSNFTLTEAQVGKSISVIASYTDGHGTVESRVSSSTASVANVNDAVTGAVSISGLVEQGQILTASNNLTDADGLGTISYTWKADGNVIGSGPSFTLTEAQVGKSISVVASYTDGHGTVESVASAATANVLNVNDAAIGSVSISGLVEQGQILTASNTLADLDGLGTINYSWKDNLGNTLGTGASISLTEAHVGKSISVIASYTDGHGTAESRVSASTANVANINDAVTGSVSISGVATQGQVLTASNTLADADGLGPISYTWKADGNVIGSDASFTLTEAQVGKIISVVASYTDGHGTVESVASAATANVLNVNDAAIGSVSISGLVEQGQILTASNNLTDADGLGAISYTWKADGNVIGSGPSFTLTEAQVGKSISVVASYTDGHGTVESVASAATANVLNVNDAPTGSLVISGVAEQGQTLTVSNTLQDLDGLPALGYTNISWQDNEGQFLGYGTSLTLGQNQVGKTISAKVSYTDGHGTAESVSSASTAAVANIQVAPTGTLQINGSPVVGQELQADFFGVYDADGISGSVTFVWTDDNGNTLATIPGSTYLGFGINGIGARILVTPEMEGQSFHLNATYVDGDGKTETLNAVSAPVAHIEIVGTAEEGQVLTLNHNLVGSNLFFEWLDQNGMPVGWGESLLLTDAHVGKTLAVRVALHGPYNTWIQISTSATSPVANVNDAPVGEVIINGTLEVGEILFVNLSNITDADGFTGYGLMDPSTNFQWFADGQAVGNNAPSLTLSANEAGKSITLQVSYVDAHGTSETITQSLNGLVVDPYDIHIGISGLAEQGQVLTATHTLTNTSGWNFVWFDSQGMFQGVGPTLTLTEAQVGKSLSVRALFWESQPGVLHESSSNLTAPVANVNDAPVGEVTIFGTLAVGQNLFAGLAGITDADGFTGPGLMSPSTHFQWLADGQAVGNDAPSVTLSTAEAGKHISLQVSYVDAHGTLEQINSALSAMVIDPFA